MGMSLPIKSESIAPLIKGAALGAIAAMVIGFNWGGWTTGSSADKQSKADVKTSLIAALAPICVDNFQTSVDAAANLIALKEAKSYQRTDFVEKGGWAVLPGNEKANDGVAKQCATLLSEL